jgi:hypothetical protein
VSRSLTSIRLALAGVVAAVALVFAVPAMAMPVHDAPNPQSPAVPPQVLPSGHHAQGAVHVTATPVSSSSSDFSWDDALVTGAAGVLLGAGLMLGGMTLWRRHDQPVAAA